MANNTTQTDTRLEREIQAAIIKRMERDGWYVIKLIQTNKNGIPDLLCHQGGNTIYIEVKRQEGYLSKLQEHRIQELKRNGIAAFVVKSERQLYLMGILKEL